jgi:hypothetical protein
MLVAATMAGCSEDGAPTVTAGPNVAGEEWLGTVYDEGFMASGISAEILGTNKHRFDLPPGVLQAWLNLTVSNLTAPGELTVLFKPPGCGVQQQCCEAHDTVRGRLNLRADHPQPGSWQLLLHTTDETIIQSGHLRFEVANPGPQSTTGGQGAALSCA